MVKNLRKKKKTETWIGENWKWEEEESVDSLFGRIWKFREKRSQEGKNLEGAREEDKKSHKLKKKLNKSLTSQLVECRNQEKSK